MIDSTKFFAWFARHAAAMRLYARQWLRDRDEAEDVVHEAFVALLTRMARVDWREPENIRAWLFGVVRNLAMTHVRSTSRRRIRERLVSGVARDAFSMFDARIDDLIDARAAQDALDELSIEQRELVVLRIWGELSFPEIARLTNQRVSTVFDRYRAALAQMRSQLERIRRPCDTTTTDTANRNGSAT